MRWPVAVLCRASLLAGCHALIPAAHADATGGERHWTIGDIATVPDVSELSIASDGATALYVANIANLSAGKVEAILRSVDLRTGVQHELVRSGYIARLRRIPGTDQWSALLDRGEGVQLYRIDPSGAVEPILVRRDTVRVGNADQAIPPLSDGAPRNVGIWSYDWSPDGRRLWYSVLKPEAAHGDALLDSAVLAQRNRRRPPLAATIDYHLHMEDGSDVMVASRPTGDRMALYFGGNITWRSDSLVFQIEEIGADGISSFAAMVWNMASRSGAVEQANAPVESLFAQRGPYGGTLATTGFGDSRQLKETRSDGNVHVYGAVGFTLGDIRAAGSWLSASGDIAVMGTRTIRNPAYGLAVIGRDGVRTVRSNHSLTRCDFVADLHMGACIEEGQAMPPRIVKVFPEKGKVFPVASVSPTHDRIRPLRISARQWTNRQGLVSTGFIVWPRDYVPGRRYPAIVVTHGSDADDRFSEPSFQWNYPVQVMAERGYLVLLVNDPAPGQSEELSAAYDEWGNGGGPLGVAEVQRLIWLNSVYSIEDALHALVAEGLVDPDRIGIAGYSRGSQIANVAMTQSTMFRAASSGDGGFLEPGGYPDAPHSYDAIFGGSPYGERLPDYQRLSPSLRAEHACGAILLQMASPYGGALDFYTALRSAQVPAQISLYPGEDAASDETHIFHIPQNRLRAMQENLDWFDFWLSPPDQRQSTSDPRERQWTALRQDFKSPCVSQ